MIVIYLNKKRYIKSSIKTYLYIIKKMILSQTKKNIFYTFFFNVYTLLKFEQTYIVYPILYINIAHNIYMLLQYIYI